MYCPECAYQNPDQNRFCGMCGERLPDRNHRVKTTREEFGHREKWVEAPARPEANPIPPVTRSEARTEERRGTYKPSEPAPSFLGLGNAEYEKPEREISWRFWALMLLLLGVVALFGMQWRAGKLRANQPEPEKPAATQPAEEPAVRNEPPNAEGKEAQPAAEPTTDKTAKPATDEKPAPEESQPAETKPKGQGDEPKSETDSNEPDQPKTEQQQPETRAASTPREFSDGPVKQADAFIAAGRCPEALRILRAAGDNPKAMTKLGAMYLTGSCVEPDRVTAYAWFSQAFAADPHNLRLESTRRSIWSQMSDEERARVEAGVRPR